jgi:hypothetical protein
LLGGAFLAHSGPSLVNGQEAVDWPKRVRADWLQAEEVALLSPGSKPVSTQDDAAGGCDGIKNGEWGFHTGEAKDPWWQVDLGRTHSVVRVVVWNRREAAERAQRIRLLLSENGREFRQVYQHDGTVFHGLKDGKPLVIELPDQPARYVRLALPGTSFLHLDEIEVFGASDPQRNLALRQPADQVSVSQWSASHAVARGVDWESRARETLTVCERLLGEVQTTSAEPGGAAAGAARQADVLALKNLRERAGRLSAGASAQDLFLEARALQRRLALQNPLLARFDTLLFSKRVPGSFNHMSDQYYGWWSKPGGGIYLLRGFLSGLPQEECLTTSFTEPGSFLRPTLSCDAKKVLFAWCRHYPHLAAEANKLDKANVPEDAFYQLFEMNLNGSGVRRLTHGKYDNFDGRYLPDGRIVFLSTRRGQSLQAGQESAARTLARADLPDCYVRCGGGPERPVAVYTLHTMNADGTGLCAISPFEMFEWTPEVAADGSIVYSRWDYIDRDNMPYMGLWAINPDGSNARMLYKNYTSAPHCTFEPRPVPGSHKLVFTASAHHAQTMGSLVLLDPSSGLEGREPITRLTPEVAFPEIEGWPLTYYANPWPLSERFHLVAWGCEGARVSGPTGWDRWHAVQRPSDGLALYLYDAETRTRELLWADAQVACGDPIPVGSRERPTQLAPQTAGHGPKEGSFLVTDVYRGLPSVPQGSVKALRLVAVPAKTHPTMNYPSVGLTADDPGKCVLGTVPVEPDGSAYFRAPAGVILFFQALDEHGVTLQTMRSVTHVQPGQTLGCIGCHEHRQQAPPAQVVAALARSPSLLTAGPEGSWPLRFDRLVQPVLDSQCVACHQPQSTNAIAARFDLTPAKAYESLVGYGKPNLRDQVMRGYRRGYSIPGEGLAQESVLWSLLTASPGHYGVALDSGSRERLLTWIDTYAQRLGHFSDQQEQELIELRRAWAHLMVGLLPQSRSATPIPAKSNRELTRN